MPGNDNTWDIEHLRSHLQFAVQLEYWTIPFYMASMYSVQDPTTTSYKLIQSVVYQEMFHVQCAANVANAFGAEINLDDVFIPPQYVGTMVPHLRFKKGETDRDPLDPTQSYTPYSAEIGPLDELRVNAMCLIEYPEDDVDTPPELNENALEYATIGEFYRAVLFGATQNVEHIVGNRNQVDIFKNFYRDMATQTVTSTGVFGLEQVLELLLAITDQGEGFQRTAEIPERYRNTTDGFNTEEDHFAKFNQIKNLAIAATIFTGDPTPPPGSAGAEAQEILLGNFDRFRGDLVALFNGQAPEDFGPNMAILGGNILNCWRSGATPVFAESEHCT